MLITGPVFFDLLWRSWPDCPYPVYPGTNSGDYPDPRVRMIRVRPDLSCGDTALAMLSVIPTPNVLWFLDDFLSTLQTARPKSRGCLK